MTNPLLAPSPLPYELPQWSAIKPEHVEPALEAAMAAQRLAWEDIATNTEPVTVENTVNAIEDSGRHLNWVASVAYTLISSVGGKEYEAVEAAIGPKLAEHANIYRLDKRIYDRLVELERSALEGETAYYVSEEIKAFRLGGIELNDAGKDRLRALDAQISGLEISFSQKVIQAMADNELVITDVAELEGVPDSTLSAWKQSDGTYRVPIDNYTNQPVSTTMIRPETRRRLLATSVARGLGEQESSDTRDIVLQIARARAERAELLGFANHAEVVAAREMAGSAEAIIDLLHPVATTAVAAVEQDARKLADLATIDPHGAGLEAGDWMYYEDMARAELGVDESVLRQYFELSHVLEKGVFFAAHRIYGLTFEPRPDLQGYVPTMRTWEVKNEDGEAIALFQADFFRRAGKSGGAWMNSIIEGSTHDGNRPIILNNCNFAEPAAGEACLLSWDNVITMFHEFGHALHGMLTRTMYRSQAGTNVPRDFVELPSQLNEMWAWHPQVIANYAIHHESGEPLPQELIDKLVAAKTFGQPFATTEFVASALLDQAWHRIGSDEVPSDVVEFERSALEEFGVLVELVPPRYRSAYFAHTFGGGYDAGYYSYMWAEVLVADLEQWFAEQSVSGDGGFNREAGRIYEEELLSRGGSRSPMESFIAVRGREPRPEALLERRGLA